jgi:CelD/BcsL family acetyltransferase involved in cellulose biosynthesis
MTVELEASDALEPLRDEWDQLAEASRNIFATWDWVRLWWRHFGSERRLHVVAVREGGRLAAILPLYAWRERPLRVLRFVGHGPGDELGPICAPADRKLATAAVRETLMSAGANILVAEHIPGGLPGARVLGRTGSPVLDLHGRSWDELLAQRSRNFRAQVRGRERKLEREHELRFRTASDLDTLIALHRERWSGRVDAFAGAAEAFHREFASAACKRDQLRVWHLELDGRIVAAWYGLRFASVESYYQAGRNPAFDRESVGSVLLIHTIRTALEDGMDEYRYLRGGEEYKYRFADRDDGLETVALSRGAAGGAAVNLVRAWRRLR